MNYKNGKEVLPSELLVQIQKYVQGEMLYIPKEDEKRVAWGENSGAKKALALRNREIVTKYRNGQQIEKLTKTYNLSKSSVKKIVYTYSY